MSKQCLDRFDLEEKIMHCWTVTDCLVDLEEMTKSQDESLFSLKTTLEGVSRIYDHSFSNILRIAKIIGYGDFSKLYLEGGALSFYDDRFDKGTLESVRTKKQLRKLTKSIRKRLDENFSNLQVEFNDFIALQFKRQI